MSPALRDALARAFDGSDSAADGTYSERLTIGGVPYKLHVRVEVQPDGRPAIYARLVPR